MMLIITCAGGGGGGGGGVRGKFDKNGGVWCILSVPKLVIINLKKSTLFFFIINQKPKFVPYFSLR